MSAVHVEVAKRHDAVLLFDVSDGNPNGDPDAGNLPRVDPETMQGLVTDVAIKRKVRDYVDAIRGRDERFKIYVQAGKFLSEKQERAYTALAIKSGSKERSDHDAAKKWMCDNFYDIRTFGAVLSVTEFKAGQVRGPVQATFARSIDPIVPLDLSITRVALTNAKEERQATDSEGEGSTHGTMARKSLVPYGLYVGKIFYSPQQAHDTGFSNDDLALFWEALERMWDFDRSAARGMMACRGIFVFSHDNPYGNAPAHKLLDRISVEKNDGVIAPRSFADYRVTVAEEPLPDGVTLTHLGG